MNTSGSGKTKLLFEGVFRNWVLYFSSAVDASNLGSTDIQDLIERLVSGSTLFTETLPKDPEADLRSKLEDNRAVVLRCLRQMMMARLLIFREFLQAAKEHRPVELKNSPNRLQLDWLMLQLLPSIVFDTDGSAMDAFAELTTLLHEATDSYLETTANLMGAVERLYDPNVTILGFVLGTMRRTTPKICYGFTIRKRHHFSFPLTTWVPTSSSYYDYEAGV